MVLPENKLWGDYAVRNYIAVVLPIFALLIFWYRYYQKYFVVTEYLNTVIFIFTLSNIVETMHFIAFQWNAQVWYYGQIFYIVLNSLMLIVWYARLLYLNSDISTENERYLMNFQYLNGFVSKPKPGLVNRIVPFFSLTSLAAVFVRLTLILLGLYVINKITFYLMLNTVFIVFAVALALFFSFSSIKRDWQNQVGIFFTKNKK